ncbi:putative Ig domain-containing protein, partial [Paracidovorax cattleyae]|uniref:putative Ig domain-containing protein n=1 Tax=Paracidovorax cattleyae TaxID=80868 RepID=UPI001ABFD75F
MNQPPESRNTIDAQSFKRGSSWTYAVPAGTFVDEDGMETMTYSASLSNGSALPSWLTFDAASQTFKASATATTGTYEIVVTAKDPWDASASQRFSLTVQAGAITGTSRNDTLTGTSGNDTIDGLAGADTMSGLAGDDIYIVDNTGDKVVESANAGKDTVMSSITYTLAENVEDLALTGSSAIDGAGNALGNRLSGNAAGNALTGGNGDDTLDGGAGNDTLSGGAGNDTYLFGRGDGQDTITFDYTALEGKLNAVRFKPGVGAQDVTVRRVRDALVLGIAGTTDQVTVENFFFIDDPQNLSNPVQQVLFADGTTWDIDALSVMAMVGGAGDDTIVGTAGADVIDGRAGNDRLSGKAGNDTYLFGRGDGQDSITYDYTALEG